MSYYPYPDEPGNDPQPRYVRCSVCHGLGYDRDYPDLDCIECEGYGDIEVW